MIPFGPFRPDQPPGQFCRSLYGVIPKQDAGSVSYGPMQQFATAPGAGALGVASLGAISIIKADGSFAAFAGVSDGIKQLDADFTWSDLDTSLSSTSGYDWSFEHFGVYLVYTNTTEGMRACDIETPGSPAAVSDGPDAAFVFSCNNTLIALNCDGDNRRWENCALGNHTNWTSLEANGGTLQDGGELIAGGDIGNGYAIVVQSDAVRLFRVGGGTTLVSQSKLADEIGCVGARSFIPFNGVAYWLDKRGFFMSNGQAPVPIGSGKVNRTFLGSVGENGADVRAAVDPDNEIIWWHYGTLAYGFHWPTGEWCRVSAELQAFFRLATPGYNYGTASGFTYGSASELTYGSRFWKGNSPSLAGIGLDGKVGFFNGETMGYEIDTPLLSSPTRDLYKSVTPVTDNAAASTAIATVDQIGADLTFGTDVGQQPSGRCPVRGAGKHAAFRVRGAAGAIWTYARGVDAVEARRGGAR